MLGILLGIITFFWPGITLAGLVILFGAYALMDGVLRFAGAIRAAGAGERWGSLVFEGLIGVAAGVFTIIRPGITLLALVWVIAAWAIFTGIFELISAVRLRQHIRGEWLLVLGGIASVIFGILLFLAPRAGALVLALWVGAYAFIFGVMMVALGFRLRSWDHHLLPGSTIPAPAH